MQIMLWRLAFYSATLLNYVPLFSVMFRSLDRQLEFYLADNYVGRFLDLWFLLLSSIPNFVRLFGTLEYYVHNVVSASGLEPS